MYRSLPGLICLFACFFSFQFHTTASDRALVQVTPGQIGLSEEKLDSITRYLQAEVDQGHVAAAVGVVARHGRIGYFEAMGDCEKESLFRLASMTKAITTVAVMQLVEEGAIRLNQPVSRYLPAFKSLKVIGEDGSLADVAQAPTIDQLLTHTSGIGYGWGDGPQDKAYQAAGIQNLLIPNTDSLGEHVDKLAKLPLAFNPGEQWTYGQSLDILGRVVEVVSGLTLEQYFQERIFRPLKIKDTRFYLNKKQQENLVTLYTPGDSGELVEVGSDILSAGAIKFSTDFGFQGKGRLFAGGSGLTGSSMDYMRFLQMLLNNGSLEGVSLLKPSTVDLMTRNQIGELTIPFPNHGETFGYGFGVLTERGKAEDVASVGSYSWGGLYYTYYWVDPQEELIGLVMTQIFPNNHLKIRENFKQLVYDAIADSGFTRRYWYQEGLEYGNPFFNGKQLRVNSPGIVVHPVHATRTETQSSGLARILIEEDLREIDGASLYCEIWGGHPGTLNKRVSINGRTLMSIPETGTATQNCTHGYPEFRLAPTDLVNGYNSLQFACDKPGAGWGHFIVENLAINIHLPREHPDLVAHGLDTFDASVNVTVSPGSEVIHLELESDELKAISRVLFQARYHGYDENGNRWKTDWHGMTKEREAYGMLGQVDQAPFEWEWDVSMLPAQTRVEVKALLFLNDEYNVPIQSVEVDEPVLIDRPDSSDKAGESEVLDESVGIDEYQPHSESELMFETAPVKGLGINERKNSRVSLYNSKDLPQPFWSRVERIKECTIELDMNPADIEKAELHVVSWTGGAGTVTDYFTLNGHFMPIAEGSGHAVEYSVLEVDPQILKQGKNSFRLVSDTEHHGIEILLPGPALMIRSKVE